MPADGGPDEFPHFVRIDRDGRGATARHFVVHTQSPAFMLEPVPDAAASGRVSRGVIKRGCVPNSGAGDYGRYAKLLAAAQEFYAQSGDACAPSRGA